MKKPPAEPRITIEKSIAKVKDMPAYMSYLKRQLEIGRKRLNCDGRWMSPQAAIDYVLERFPWLG